MCMDKLQYKVNLVMCDAYEQSRMHAKFGNIRCTSNN